MRDWKEYQYCSFLSFLFFPSSINVSWGAFNVVECFVLDQALILYKGIQARQHANTHQLDGGIKIKRHKHIYQSHKSTKSSETYLCILSLISSRPQCARVCVCTGVSGSVCVHVHWLGEFACAVLHLLCISCSGRLFQGRGQKKAAPALRGQDVLKWASWAPLSRLMIIIPPLRCPLRPRACADSGTNYSALQLYTRFSLRNHLPYLNEKENIVVSKRRQTFAWRGLLVWGESP